MCLSTVSSEKPKSSGIGYKVFRVDNNENLYPPYYFTGRPIRIGEKQVNLNLTNFIYGDDNKKYKAGFHIFATLKGAQAYLLRDSDYHVIAKVEYKKAYRKGTQCVVHYIGGDYEDFKRASYSVIISNEYTVLEILK